jgi:fucose permease
VSSTASRVTSSSLILLVSFLAFISIGFPDAVLGVAWPSIRDVFGLPKSGLSFILVTSGAGYILSGLIAGKLIEWLGVGTLLVVSTAAVALALLGYAIAPAFPVFLCFAIFVGLGSGAIDSALNFFAAEHFTEAVMNRLHAFFGIGALIGPLIMGAVLEYDASWRWGYVIVAVILLAMMTCFVWTRDLWDDHATAHHADAGPRAAPFSVVLASPVVWLHIAIFFFCTGVEFTAGQWAFTVMSERFGQTAGIASLWAGLYWGALALGRLTLGAVSERLGTARTVQASIGGNIVGGILYATGNYEIAVIGLMVMGYFMAPLFPLLMSLTPRRMGSAIAAHAVGFQVSAAILGGAVVPGIAGFIATRTDQSAIGWVAVAGGVVFFLLHGQAMRMDATRG